MKKTRLSAKRKSELCLACGKCCMEMTFSGGEVDDAARDEIRWMEFHGLKVEYLEVGDRVEYYFTIPKRCNALEDVKTEDGQTQYVCSIYETRPQMCRDYDGSIDGPFGMADCLWRKETNSSNRRLVQLGVQDK